MARSLRRKISLGILAILLVAMGVVPFLRADGDEDSPTLAELERPQKVIVLETGRVVLGDIVDRPGGYLVKERFGSAVIPYGKVRLTAADLPDAYRKLSRMVTEPTAGKHLALAKWCRENQLYGSAKFEIKQALLLEPARKDSRRFLRELEDELENGPPAGRGGNVRLTRGPIERASELEFPGQPWRSRIRPASAALTTQEPKSSAGLSPQVVQTFVREVQPLLMNKCGNVRCHGQAATNDFRLTIVRRGSSGFRVLTEQNLSSVLREIDLQEPSQSRLLTSPQQVGHGGGRKPLFRGPSADQQQEKLRAWVLLAATEQARAALIKGEPVRPHPEDASPPPQSSLRDSFLDKILAEDHPDKFDPEVFNRLMHVGSGKPNGLR